MYPGGGANAHFTPVHIHCAVLPTSTTRNVFNPFPQDSAMVYC